MAGAQEEPRKAPFKSAREGGFVYHAPSFRVAHAALDQAFLTNRFPLVLEGPRGVGKATSLLFWLRAQASETITATAVEASSIDPADIARSLLKALGFEPDGAASSEEALQDAIEDAAFDEAPMVVAVIDADELDGTALASLTALARPVSAGGVGLPLVLTASRPLALEGAETVRLERMTPSVALRFFRAVLTAADQRELGIEEEAAALLAEQGRGLMAEAGLLFDEAVASALAEGSKRITVRHIELKAQPGPAAPRSEPEAGGAAPSPADIEKALLALESGGDPRIQAAKVERPRTDFPRIETEQGLTFDRAPANDPRQRIDPALVSDLTALKASIAALQESITAIRNEATALGRALSGRSQKIGDAASAVAETTRDVIRDQHSGSRNG